MCESVFLLWDSYDYDGRSVISVHSTKESAGRDMDLMVKSLADSDDYYKQWLRTYDGWECGDRTIYIEEYIVLKEVENA